MKMARILVVLALLVVVAGTAQAQQAAPGCYRLSWNTIGTQVADQPWAGPAIYKLVLSATAVDQPNVGHDSNIIIGPNVQDAWRFDDLGCQTGSQLVLASTAFSKTYPAMRGLNPLAITFYGYDMATHNTALRLAITYDEFAPVAATFYTLWQISFDHSYSVAGPTTPTVNCGGAELGLNLDVEYCQMLQSSGTANFIGMCPNDARCTWAGGPAVPTVPATWGKVKGLYR
jgi:hypothetical protein